MKQLNEMFEEDDLSLFIQLNEEKKLNEGVIGDFLKKTWNYLKGKIAKVGKYFVSVFDDKVMPVMLPITSQIALKNGEIPDSKGIHWVGTKEDKKYSGVDTTGEEAIKARPKCMDYWLSLPEIDESYLFSGIPLDEALKLETDDPEMENVDNDELKRLIRIKILRGKDTTPLLIWGAPGVGKTQIIKAVLEEVRGKDAELLDMQLSMKEHDDFFLPTYNVTKTKAIDIPKSYLPVWQELPGMTEEEKQACSDACGKGLLFLDELSRAKKQVQNVCLKLIYERRLGDNYRLGDGWSIICATNRLEDSTGGGQYSLEPALCNRMEQVNFTPMLKYWKEWASKHKFMNSFVLEWLEQNEKYFYFQNKDAEDTTIFSSPRAWEACCKALGEMAGTLKSEDGYDLFSLPDKDIRKAFGRTVGKTIASSFMEYVKLARSVDIEKLKNVFTDPDKAPLPQKEGTNYRSDLVFAFTTSILNFCKKQPTGKEFENLCKYYTRLDDMSAAALMFKLINTKFPDMNYGYGESTEGKFNDEYLAGLQVLIKAYPEWEEEDFE